MRVKQIEDKEKALKILSKIRENNGYCPCVPEFARTSDTICLCKEFRDSPVGTLCHCGLYIKTEE